MTKTGRRADLSGCAVYDHPQTKFAVCDFTQLINGEAICGRAYFTVINGQTICIMLLSREGGITGGIAQTIESTVDGIVFTETSSSPVNDLIAVYAGLAGAAAGAVIGAIIFVLRKRRSAETNGDSLYRPGSINV